MLSNNVIFFAKFLCYRKLSEKEQEKISVETEKVIKVSKEKFKGLSLVGVIWEEFEMWCCSKKVSSFKVILEVLSDSPSETVSDSRIINFLSKLKNNLKVVTEHFLLKTWRKEE